MFQCQSGYTLRKIKDTCYLLPYGQQIADQRKGMVLNETGTLLWNLLQHNEGMEFDDLVSTIAKIYHLDSDSIPMLCDDVRDFLTQLQANGILVEDLHPTSNFTTIYLEIAGLKLQIYDPKRLLLEQRHSRILTLLVLNRILFQMPKLTSVLNCLQFLRQATPMEKYCFKTRN